MTRRRLLAVSAAMLGMIAIAPLGAEPLPCLRDVSGVTWIRWNGRQDTLNRWCESVGPPVFTTVPEREGVLSRLLVISWNVHVGGADLDELMAKALAPLPHTDTGLIILMQEAFRAGADVPESLPRDPDVPSAIRPRRPSPDVIATAQRLGMSVAYVPSMRNGPATSLDSREDRGNAILSTEPLTDIRAIELPFGKQRRVAVAATVVLRGSTIRVMRVVTAHFDTNSDRVDQAQALADALDSPIAIPLVVGGDLNSRRGFSDRAVTTMAQRIPLESCGTQRTSRWPWRLDIPLFFLIGRVDFIFSTLDSSITRSCQTLSHAYDSDHLPILLDVSLPQ